MLFNTLSFAIFLPVVFVLYWLVAKNMKTQNALLLVASYFFYACWDYRFAFLLLFSTVLDYFTGLKMEDSESENKRKFWFWLSVAVNLGFLGVFKYYNFFVASMAESLASIGFKTSFWTLQVILPVGISFYTFHGLSYVIDIYKKQIRAERNFVDYAVFVSFFPLLVAGPIERATHLLPQIQRERSFDTQKATDGLRQILWGLFKKIVIADNCAMYANAIFNDSATMNGSTLVLGAVFFTFQIYGDFSGYSDIALGTARLFGVELLRNFAFPYFSRDIAEFWRRWHISLSSWFRDYLYIPLGGSKGGMLQKIRNTFIIFLVSGFWHGAKWTFLVWGALNALYILPLVIFGWNRNNLQTVAQGKLFPTGKEILQMLFTFGLTVFAWIFFRADSVTQAFAIVSKIASASLFSIPFFDDRMNATITLCLVFIFISIEWLGREKPYAIARLEEYLPKGARYTFYYSLLILMFYFAGGEQNFIYFQF
jgi:alginate O-acetyltransferase complex protein AlgI